MTIFFSIIAYFALGFAVAFLGTKVRVFKDGYLYIVDNRHDFSLCFVFWPVFLFMMVVILLNRILTNLFERFDFYKDLDN